MCGEGEFHDSFLKRFGFFFMLVIFGGIIFHMRIARDIMKRPLHLYDTWGATYCPRVSRPGGGVISIMLFRIL